MTLTLNIHLATLAAQAAGDLDSWDTMGVSMPDTFLKYNWQLPGWKQAKWEVEDEDEAQEVMEALVNLTWARINS